ncbi:hypothetical protein B0T24DRAFT_708394 [Lasiosphaeria ovina]|uniref:Uncharacterized protein n=1 Tax=Lasiosphaeria ovina TaxID=92902 RepID=A0AAE0K490_9PEZI|nr:hypothetical protein B0T24DRAFT_708394 [Lasiosphaeria ovina]
MTKCYSFGDIAYANNTVCPGSNTCCAPDAACLSNRLCHNLGDAPNVWIRGPCSVKGWKGASCPQICLYDERGGRFPRVTPCEDGSLCCSNEPQCCSNRKGVFLDEDGNIALSRATAPTVTFTPVAGTGGARAPVTASTPTNAPITASTSTAQTTSTILPLQLPTSAAASSSAAPTQLEVASAENTASPTAEDTASSQAKIGFGVGVPLAGLLALALAYVLLPRRCIRCKTRRTRLKVLPTRTTPRGYVGRGGPGISGAPPAGAGTMTELHADHGWYHSSVDSHRRLLLLQPPPAEMGSTPTAELEAAGRDRLQPPRDLVGSV